MYKETLHHSVTSILNQNDVAYWDYTGGRQFVVSLSIMSHQLKDILMVQHAVERFESKISQISLTAANLSVSCSCVLSCGLSKQMWPLRNLKRFFDIIAPKTKWLSFENSLSVIWRFTPSIPLKYINPNNASILTLSVFWPMCTCLIHWSYHLL